MPFNLMSYSITSTTTNIFTINTLPHTSQNAYIFMLHQLTSQKNIKPLKTSSLYNHLNFISSFTLFINLSQFHTKKQFIYNTKHNKTTHHCSNILLPHRKLLQQPPRLIHPILCWCRQSRKLSSTKYIPLSSHVKPPLFHHVEQPSNSLCAATMRMTSSHDSASNTTSYHNLFCTLHYHSST